MIRILILLLGLYASLYTLHASAETDEQLAAIEEMGRLYGIALPCKYLEQTRRIKSEMVDALPKKRHLGQLFEQETNRAFLEFVESRAACPAESALAAELDRAVEELNRVFQQSSPQS